MSSPAPSRVFMVVGCGLIGSSLARAARRFGAAKRILVVDPDPKTRARVVELGLADDVADDPKVFEGEADLIAICTPPRAIVDATLNALESANDEAVVFDVGSVKGPVSEAVAARAGDRAHAFVPAHPIAGTEQSGPDAGYADLFENRWCILTPSVAAPEAAARVAAFWRACGARVAAMTTGQHDALLAATSHVPHLIAYALTATAQDDTGALDEPVVRYSAGGFRDFTRIAASDPVMWRDVFLQNRDSVLSALDRFERRLATLRAAVEAGDADQLEDAFRRTRAVRAEIVAEGQETPAPDFGRPHGETLDRKS